MGELLAERAIRALWLVLLLSEMGCVTPQLRWRTPWAAPSGLSEHQAPLLTMELGPEPHVRNVTLLTDSALSKKEEELLVRLNQGHGVLLPFNTLHAGRDVVVFVHGRGGTVADFDQLIARIDAQNKQVCVFLYDDAGRYLNHSGEELAKSLLQLQSTYFGGQRLRLEIVAHSMGGIVARAGLNSLADPHWFGIEPLVLSAPRGESGASLFESVELIAIDTPWGGYGTAPRALRDMVPLENSLVDMSATSALLTRVNRVKLPPNFSMRLMEADQRAAGLAPDHVVTLGELDDHDTRLLERLLLGSTFGRDASPDLLNQVEALRSTAGFDELLRGLHSASTASEMRPAEFRALLAKEVRRYAGSHSSVLKNPELIEAIARDTGDFH